MSKTYKLIVHVPLSHTDDVRNAIGDAGGGAIGNYTHCSFTTRGTGRFKGNEHSNPAVGHAGLYEHVEEECIEVSPIAAEVLREVIAAMKKVHPYEEVAYQVIELVDVGGL
jgi:hypothetical protein